MSTWLLVYLGTVALLLWFARKSYWVGFKKGHDDGARVALLQYKGVMSVSKKAMQFYRKALLEATGFDYEAGIKNPHLAEPELKMYVRAKLTDCKRSAN